MLSAEIQYSNRHHGDYECSPKTSQRQVLICINGYSSKEVYTGTYLP